MPESPARERRPAPEPAQSAQPTSARLWDAAEPEPPFPAAPPEQRPPANERRAPADDRRRGGAETRQPSPAASRPPAAPERAPRDPSPRREPPPAAPDEGLPDATALIERLRRQRQQREDRPAARRGSPAQSDRPSAPVEQRFAPGDRVFCLPYGDGVVEESRVDDGRELLRVSFPEHGELEVDPAVSLVRKLEDEKPFDDDLL